MPSVLPSLPEKRSVHVCLCTRSLTQSNQESKTKPLPSFPWCDWCSNRGACDAWRCCCCGGGAVFALIETLDDLTDVVFSLGLVGRRPDTLKRVWCLDQDRVTDHNLSVCPASRETVILRSANFTLSALSLKIYSRSGNGIKQLLSLFTNAFALLCVLLPHLTNGLFLTGMCRSHVDFVDARKSTIEAASSITGSLSRTNNVERYYVCKWDYVVVARLARKRRRRIGRCGGSIYSNSIGDIACCKEGAFKHRVVGSTCQFDAATY